MFGDVNLGFLSRAERVGEHVPHRMAHSAAARSPGVCSRTVAAQESSRVSWRMTPSRSRYNRLSPTCATTSWPSVTSALTMVVPMPV